jgi:hypothetical protein
MSTQNFGYKTSDIKNSDTKLRIQNFGYKTSDKISIEENIPEIQKNIPEIQKNIPICKRTFRRYKRTFRYVKEHSGDTKEHSGERSASDLSITYSFLWHCCSDFCKKNNSVNSFVYLQCIVYSV